MMHEAFKLNDIVTLKLVGGDEIIGKLTDERTQDYIEISKPLLIVMAQQGFGLMPYILTADDKTGIRISTQHVICSTLTMKNVKSEYIKQTTNLIV